MAHKLAMLNPNVVADVVEAVEFPDLAQQYRLYGVPKTVVNDRVAFEGAFPERRFMREVMKALEEPEEGAETPAEA